MTQTRQAAEATLAKNWGYPAFREGQWDVIEPVLNGEDVLAILPTGGGKSICYQVPALMHEGLTLVVSPLIALMQDQVAGLKARGISATFINSTLKHRVVEQRWTDAEFGRYKLVYLAPERLQSELFLARAHRLSVKLLAVDEAHCVSEWGPHFRPAYLDIPKARTALGDPAVIAVTATATPEVRRDIQTYLQLNQPRVIVQGFDRPNLVWTIFRTENKPVDVRRILNNVEGSGLVYAATRRGVEQWTARLRKRDIEAEAYHAGLKTEVRKAVQERWLKGETRVVVATNAFGMGIDKPDVRFVVHVDMPGSVEAYYQEAGRAGRDGEKAYVVLLYSNRDEKIHQDLLEASHPDVKTIQQVYTAVCNLAQIPLGSLPDAPVSIQPEKIAGMLGMSASRIQAAIELLIRQEIWQPLELHAHKGYVQFLQPANTVRAYVQNLKNNKVMHFVQTLLRSVHAEAFTGWWPLDLPLLERRLKLPRKRVLRGMDFLAEQGLVRWQPPGKLMQVQFTDPRTRTVPVEVSLVQRAKRRAEVRLGYMLRYARSVSCRRHFLMAYFGATSAVPCGRCDLCLGRHEPVIITPEDEPMLRHIMHQIGQGQDRTKWFAGLDAPTSPPAHRVDGLLDWLVQEGYIAVDNLLDGTFTLMPQASTFLSQWAPQ